MAGNDRQKRPEDAVSDSGPTTRTVLFRCHAPTDIVCPCGRVARSLKRAGIEFETRRVAFSRRRRPEIVELTGQRLVPVLVHGDEVVHDSRRIVEYVGREFGTR